MTRPRLWSLLVLVHDVAVSAAGMAAVLLIRYAFEDKPTPYDMIALATGVFAGVCVLVYPAMGLHRGMWRFTALSDVLRLGRAVLTANLLMLPVVFAVNRLEDFPRSTPFVAVVAVTMLLSLGRVIARSAFSYGPGGGFGLEDRSETAAVLVGKVQDAADFLNAVRKGRGPTPRVAGIVALDPVAAGRTIAGVEVLGPLPRLADILMSLGAREGRPARVVVADPRPDRDLLDAVVAAAAQAGATVARARPLGGPQGAGGAAGLTPVQAADLLARPPRALDPGPARRLIDGKRVLITGAGGTIGAELTRQIAKLSPERIVLLDASEFNLYAIDQALRGDAAREGAALDWTAELGDVRDLDRLNQVFRIHQPQVVVHAAALKHVPLMQTNPCEAVLTNIGGALNVARLAQAHSEAFVFISTDKAVNPTNVMGATKRVAERVVQALFAEGPARASVVRFGNVLGSSGSVIPLFERQIAEGGPVTVTHPDMVRFFMTVQEAAGLVLQAAALPAGGAAVYVLDMGEPVRIEALARKLMALHGLRPGKDMAIVHTGLRPGEKLFEEIFYADEDVVPTGADGVLLAKAPTAPWADLQAAVLGLLAAAAGREQGEVLRRLRALEPAFTPGGG